MVQLKVIRLDKELDLPKYALKTDVGFDLRSSEDICIKQDEQKFVKTGIIIEIPKGHVGLIRDRSGVMTKHGVHTVAGTFDSAYRGEVTIALANFGNEDVYVERGMRIAQMLILPVKRCTIKEVKGLSKTERGEKGFGSTGDF